MKKKSLSRRRTFSPGQIVLTVFMLCLAITMLIPLLNIIANSFSDPMKSPYMSGLRIIPDGFSLINYEVVFSNATIIPALWNSVKITLIGTAINILLTAMAAYALTRPKLLFKGGIMVFLIIMMLFDPGTVPEYLTIKDLGLMGSQWSVILVTSVSVYYLIIMMRYFQAVPQEICESARIDGAGHMRLLFSIIIPLAKAGIATITMFYAVVRWNEYFRAGIYITKTSQTTLQVILRQYVVSNDTATLIGDKNIAKYMNILDYNALKNATIVVAIIPILLLYPFVLKYYTKDVLGGGIKG
ncbi:MAG TPA: carbohydrate ABC transporter permease [Candidatus Limiplasma pullistercoris]|nr:carbohydrate ABC transporter permease [Candidatus Limiplasma pullistercoris]